ncbi:DUF2213 domain-containing protein [Novipirellula sp. SH528]|uniref:DUF2213 domain-containing protein n=1 Tax=Novipirellula sp. SH528 TaxID=3454466 RepID=UPI003FA01B79
MLQHITINAHGKHTRYEQLNGKEYLVVPMVMMTEGVHNGSNGALYYPPHELAKTPEAWNLKPVVVYHPQFGTATTPAELAARMVGMVMNARWDGVRLRAEAWLEQERLGDLAPEVGWALANGEPVEVSTGLFTDNMPTPGTWNGEDYQFVATNYRPDHLALLPEGVGACSVADGCGLLQLNQESDEMNQHTEEGLPLPTMNFGCQCNHEAYKGEGLPLPTMNFEKPSCGCGATGAVNGGNVAPVVAPPSWPVQSHGQANNNATGGNQGGETGLPLPSTL